MSVRRAAQLESCASREDEESEDDVEGHSAQSSASSNSSSCSDEETLRLDTVRSSQVDYRNLGSSISSSSKSSRSSHRRPPPQRYCTAEGTRAVLATLTVIGLTAAAGYLVLRTPPPQAPSTESSSEATFKAVHSTDLTARGLLESPELVNLATEQVMSGGHAALETSDSQMVHSIVSAGLGNISAMMRERNPATARRLESFQLSEEQRSSVLHVVRHMGDPRVQQVGVELASAVQDFLRTPGRPAATNGLGVHIQRALQPRLAELRRLRDEVIPSPLRGTRALAAGHWGVALNTESMRVVKTFDNDWNFEFEMSRPQRFGGSSNMPRQLLQRNDDVSKKYGVAGGVVEQARVTLDQLQIFLDTFGIEIEVPAWVTSLDGKEKPFSSELISCIVDSMGDAAKTIMCPMKFASAGLDVISGITGHDETSSESMTSSSKIKDVLWRDFSRLR